MIAEIAKVWLEAGVSLIPIRADGTKRPPVQWSKYIQELPSATDVADWFGNGHQYGLALICGDVSAGLEMLELEGRAMDQDSIGKLLAQIEIRGLTPLWRELNGPHGYSEWSPSGGLHVLYRIVDHDVPGNEKIARRHATAEEIQAKPTDRFKVLAETRGTGGYVIVAPSPGQCHPSGRPWSLIEGNYGRLPFITWEDRCALHAAIREALDEIDSQKALLPSPSAPPAASSSPGLAAMRAVGGGGILSPGDDFEDKVDWSDELLLGGAGWTLESRVGITRNWTRPGKDRRDGMSATTGRDPARDRLYVFSSATEFEPETPYTKFGAYALLHHGGDHSAAARELRRIGFGDQQMAVRHDNEEFITKPGGGDLKEAPAINGEVVDEPARRKFYSHDEIGNASRLWDRVKGYYRYVCEEKQGYVFDGRAWRADFDGSLVRDMIKVTEEMAAQAAADDDESLAKWAKRSRSKSALENSCKLMASSEPGATIRYSAFNPHRHMLNLGNGVLDLETRELRPHDAKLMMTRVFGADYRPEATCPNFERFMAQALPDETMRSYVQRALGYSLLGDADRRAMFLIYGPSGTGKSTLMETMRDLFADYGGTAAPGTFKSRRESSPSNDLHGLRGKRFVTTSETAKDASFDEETLKRITGRDRIMSRDLYESNQEWVPECALWLATNHPPQFTSDDDAIWKRAKLIPFETRFADSADEIPDMARTVLAPEADGILNWLLAGLTDYLSNGLGEPEAVRAAATEHRAQSSSTIRFLEDLEAESALVFGPGERMATRELHAMYVEWCKAERCHALGARRFITQATAANKGLEYYRSNGKSWWGGVSRAVNVSILGTFMTE